jgi:hypothetical protein
MVHEAPIDDLGIFDKDVLVRHLEEASLGGPGSRKLVGMELALDAIKWLSMQEQWRQNVAEPSCGGQMGHRKPERRPEPGWMRPCPLEELEHDNPGTRANRCGV